MKNWIQAFGFHVVLDAPLHWGSAAETKEVKSRGREKTRLGRRGGEGALRRLEGGF